MGAEYALFEIPHWIIEDTLCKLRVNVGPVALLVYIMGIYWSFRRRSLSGLVFALFGSGSCLLHFLPIRHVHWQKTRAQVVGFIQRGVRALQSQFDLDTIGDAVVAERTA